AKEERLEGLAHRLRCRLLAGVSDAGSCATASITGSTKSATHSTHSRRTRAKVSRTSPHRSERASVESLGPTSRKPSAVRFHLVGRPSTPQDRVFSIDQLKFRRKSGPHCPGR